MTYRFHPKARQEMDDQGVEYDREEPGKASVFLSEIAAGIESIMKHPQAWPVIDSGLRKWLTNQFPHKVIYHYNQAEQEIYIIAVAHQARKPGYWKDRWLEY